MEKYYISITELRNRVVAVEAEDVESAIKLAEHMHYKGGLSLSDADYVGSEFADETAETVALINDGIVDKNIYELPRMINERPGEGASH